jgi:hypothetical protein
MGTKRSVPISRLVASDWSVTAGAFLVTYYGLAYGLAFLSVRLLGALIISSAMGVLLGPEIGPEALMSARQPLMESVASLKEAGHFVADGRPKNHYFPTRWQRVGSTFIVPRCIHAGSLHRPERLRFHNNANK